MLEIKPCPFCGGEGYFRTPEHERGSAFDAVSIECRQCGAVPYATMVYQGESLEKKRDVAVRHWNRRFIK